MKNQTLNQGSVTRVLARLEDALSVNDRKRIQALSPCMNVDGRIRLADALEALYSGVERKKAQGRYRAFRDRVNNVAEEAGVAFELAVDSAKRSEPELRWTWFEGESLAAEAAGEFARGEALTDEEKYVPQEGVVLGERKLRYFVSYAGDDADLAADLLSRLKLRLSLIRGYQFESWQDTDIIVGHNWFHSIQEALASCDFGLLLVSYKFLNSEFIKAHELPTFISERPDKVANLKCCIPVGIKRIDLSGKNKHLKGLEKMQVFRDSEKRFYAQRASEDRKDAFADELCDDIFRAVSRAFPIDEDGYAYALNTAAPARETSQPLLQSGKQPTCSPSRQLVAKLQSRMFDTEAFDCYIGTHGYGTDLEKLDPGARKQAHSDHQRLDAQHYLLEWALAGEGPFRFALLGDYGMGKTTNCKELTHRLLIRREAEPDMPLPIYFDLRYLGDDAKNLSKLSDIIDTVISRTWKSGHEHDDLGASEIIRLVRDEGAIAIFDGLDEVIVHMSTAEGQRFTRKLLSIRPSDTRGKLLISCRTHYFRSLRDQKTHFTMEGRDDIDADSYRAFLLLPFTEEQVSSYFQKALPERDVEQLLEMIRSVHNLPELAERPYTLSLIAKHIPQLELWRSEGKQVTGVTLYGHMVQSWLERDTGKHQLLPDHKALLMEHFAVSLWRSAKRSWSVAELEQWLMDFFIDNPRIDAHYRNKDIELLKEDLRTATFLVREGEDNFRFAHSSLQEYFHAAFIARALREGRPGDLAMKIPGIETLDFLGQLLSEQRDEHEQQAWQATFKNIRGEYREGASELALAYGLHARSKGYPCPPLAGFELKGADLRDWRFIGEQDNFLDIDGIQFQHAHLAGAKFHRCVLDAARFDEASLEGAEFIQGRAVSSSFAQANLTGTVYRDMQLRAADFTGTKLYRTQFLRCNLESVAGLSETDQAALFAQNRPERYATRPPTGAKLNAEVFTGHSGGIFALTYAPDGQTLASAGDDQTVRLWDAASGECRRILKGHDNRVLALAYAPDGQTLAYAGDDQTVRLWDAASGECRRILKGHDSGVLALAYAPDGQTLASAGYDGSVRLWLPETGREKAIRIRNLSRGQYAVQSLDKNGSGTSFIQVSPGAWRWLGWLGAAPDGKGITRYPAEVLGPLPVVDL